MSHTGRFAGKVAFITFVTGGISATSVTAPRPH
jgi:hypothetical protein